MKVQPAHTALQAYIDHYWIVQDADSWFADQQRLYAFPGITPEFIIVLEGQLNYHYLGQLTTTSESNLFAFLHAGIHLDFSQLQRFVAVVFQTRALASVGPFLQVAATDLIRQPVQALSTVFPDFDQVFLTHLRSCSSEALASTLDEWLLRHLQPEKAGFVADLTQDMPPNFRLDTLRQLTNYSVSTLERHFRKDTGLRPKQYQRLHRFRAVVEHLYATRSTDWSQYVYDFGFFDQSHLIKEVKAFTGFTPSQLVRTPGILPFRPQ